MKAIKGLEIFDGNLLVKRDEPDTDVGGIVLPDKAQKSKSTGVVVLVAKEGKEGKPMNFKVGDRIRFRQHMTGNFCDVEIDGEKYLLMPSHWIWARESR